MNVGEGDGTVQVCATLSALEDTERDFTITLSTSDGSGIRSITIIHMFKIFFPAAVAGLEYISSLSSEIFTAGSTNGATRCKLIPVTDDDALEEDKTFTLTLATPDPDVMLGTDRTTITITDNDG